MALRPSVSVRFVIVLSASLFHVPSVAQDALSWNLSQYPAGGPAFAEIVANTLGENVSLTVQTCNALAEGSPVQVASGIAGIALAVYVAPQPASDLIAEQFPDCCDRILTNDVDTNINLGVAIAHETRAWGESDIGLGRTIEQLVGLCGDEAFTRSYEIARGEDELGTLIAEGIEDGPEATGSIPLSSTPGGGLPSAN